MDVWGLNYAGLVLCEGEVSACVCVRYIQYMYCTVRLSTMENVSADIIFYGSSV